MPARLGGRRVCRCGRLPGGADPGTSLSGQPHFGLIEEGINLFLVVARPQTGGGELYKPDLIGCQGRFRYSEKRLLDSVEEGVNLLLVVPGPQKPPCAPVPRLSRSPRGTHLPARGARVRATHPLPRRSMTAIRPPRRVNPARRSGKDRSAGGQTPASTLLKRRTAPITVFVHRVSGLPGCWVVVMFNHLACAGAACGSRTPGRAGRPGSGAETDRASAVLPAS